MKKILLLLMIGLVSCKSDIEIINAVKQTIIPGVSSAKEYVKYNIQFRNDSQSIKEIEKILIVEKNTCYKVPYILLKENSPKQLSVIEDIGNYNLSVSMKEGALEVLKECDKTSNGLYIVYSENQQQKEFFIKNFKKERKTRR